jgi:hypothetical protein
MDEVVFFHQPSGTAIVADLTQTFSDRFLRKHWGWWRFLARLDGSPRTRPARRLNGDCHSSTGRLRVERERRYLAGIASASSSPAASGHEPMGMPCSRSRFVGLERNGWRPLHCRRSAAC